jgi:hypothetical protein
MAQRLPEGVSAGVDTADSILDNAWTIDSISETIDEVATQIDETVTPGTKGEDRKVLLISSNGTSYRFVDTQGTDNGSVLTAYWTSHGMSATEDVTRKTSVDQLWTEYKTDDSSGSYVLDVRGVQSDAWGSVNTTTYTQASDGDQAFTPLFATGDRPQFRITINDGKRPRIGRLSAGLRDAGQF